MEVGIPDRSEAILPSPGILSPDAELQDRSDAKTLSPCNKPD